jgi:hypothetical protein
MLQVFQRFPRYVASVSSECSKRRSDVHMLQCDPPITAIYCSCWASCMHMESGGIAAGVQAISTCAREAGERCCKRGGERHSREARGAARRSGAVGMQQARASRCLDASTSI